MPHHPANLGLAETVRADPFDRRRRRHRRRAEITGRLDPIKYATLWRKKDSVERTVLCQRKVHRASERVEEGAFRRRNGNKKKLGASSVTNAGIPCQDNQILPRWAPARRSSLFYRTTTELFVLGTSAWIKRVVLANPASLHSPASKATSEAVCHHPLDWLRLIRPHCIFWFHQKKYTIMIAFSS